MFRMGSEERRALSEKACDSVLLKLFFVDFYLVTRGRERASLGRSNLPAMISIVGNFHSS